MAQMDMVVVRGSSTMDTSRRRQPPANSFSLGLPQLYRVFFPLTSSCNLVPKSLFGQSLHTYDQMLKECESPTVSSECVDHSN